MGSIDRKYLWLSIGLGGILSLSGCGGSTVALDTQAHKDLLQNDRTLTGQTQTNYAQTVELSLPQAMERGLAYNLDARVAALEALSQKDNVTLAELRALPNLEGSGGYVGRSNVGASSSRSVLSGLQSLEPSQSSDQHRRVASLEASWNLLDSALALADASKAEEESRIAGERFTKVIQNVQKDVYTAYWRALAYQHAHEKAESLMRESANTIDNLDNAAAQKLVSSDQAGDRMAQLADRQRTLRDLADRMQMAEIELKGMLSLPLDSKIVLTTKQKDMAGWVKKFLSEDVSSQEWAALQARPEMREEVLKKNITLRDTRREIYQTFPGINLLFSRDYDSNSFLVDSTWSNYSAKIVQSLTSVVTLPARYNAAKNKEEVADARRQALSSAILAQVHIARTRLGSAEDMAKTNLQSKASASRKSHGMTGKASQGLATKMDALVAQMDYQIETMRSDLAYADLQDAYAAMAVTLGRNLYDRPVQLASVKAGTP